MKRNIRQSKPQKNIDTSNFEMNDYMLSLCGIRTKQDLILLLLETVSQLNSLKIQEQKKITKENTFSLTLSNMNRFFYKIGENKVISFVCPFTVTKQEDGSLIIFDTRAGATIDAMTISILKSIMNSDFFNLRASGPISIEDQLYELLDESFDIQNSEQTFYILSIVQHLLLFETGYIRYDFDSENQNGAYHPLHHIDVNYTDPATFKMGLKKSSTVKELISLINKQEKTYYLSNQ